MSRETYRPPEGETSSAFWQDIERHWQDPDAFFAYLSEHHDAQFTATPQEKKRIAERILEFLGDAPFFPQTNRPFLSAYFVNASLAPYARRGIRSIADEVMMRLPVFFRQQPEHAKELLQFFAQDPQIFDPEIFIQTHVAILYDPSIPVEQKHFVVAGAVYAMSVGMDGPLSRFLDAAHSSVEHMQVLVFIEELLHVGNSISFAEESVIRLRNCLERIAQESRSVLVRRKARALLGRGLSFPPSFSSGEKQAQDCIPIKNVQDPEEQARRLRARETFRIFLDEDVLRELVRDYHVDFRALTLREQLWFVTFLDSCTPEMEARVLRHAEAFGILGVRAFLSVEFGNAFGNMILDIGERFSPDVARMIFEKFSAFAHLAQNTSSEIATFFIDTQVSDAFLLAKIEERILMCGRDLIMMTRGESLHEQDIVRVLKEIALDVTLFKIVCREMANSPGGLSFDRIRDTEVRMFSGGELSAEDIAAMAHIVRTNWIIQKPEVVETLLAQFYGATRNRETHFHVLKYNNKILAFMRLDERQDGSAYCGTFHASRIAQGDRVGEAFLRQILLEEGEHRVVYADVFPELPVGMKYVEEFGAVIYGVEYVSTSSGTTPRFLIERDLQKNSFYSGKSDTFQEGACRAFRIPSELEGLVSYVAQVTREGNVVTRYFTRDGGRTREIFVEPRVYEPSAPSQR